MKNTLANMAIPPVCNLLIVLSEKSFPLIISIICCNKVPPSNTGIGNKLKTPIPMEITAINMRNALKPILADFPECSAIVIGPDKFLAEIEDIPEVTNAFLVTGQSADFILELVARNMDDYSEILLRRIGKIDSVVALHSSFVIKEYDVFNCYKLLNKL